MEEEKKKNNKFLIIMCVIVSLLIGVGIGLLLFNMLFGSEDKNKESKDNIKEDNKVKTIHDLPDGEIDINDSEVKKYFDMYKPIYLDDNLILDSLETSEIYRVQLASRLVNEMDYIEVPCSRIDSSIVEEENSYCGGVYTKSNWKNSSGTTKTIRKEIMNGYYKYYFGAEKEIPNVSFKVNQLKTENSFIYDANLNSYVEILFDGGGTGPDLITTLEKATKSGNDLILKSIEKFDIPELDNNYSTITLTLTWEEKTNHYIFKNRHSE